MKLIIMADLSPTTLQPILAHLLTWGEISSAEARCLKAEPGLALMTDAGFVQAVPDAWLIGPALKRLLPANNIDEVWQKACWSLPAYQQYLTTLAAGEIARRGLEGAGNLVEEWMMTIPHKAKSINELLDSLEQSDLTGAVIDSTPGTLLQAVKHRLQAMERNQGLDFSEWNRELLGVSAPDEAVFQAALRRGALAEILDTRMLMPVPLESITDLNTELSQPCGRLVLCSKLDHPNPLQHQALSEDPAWHIRHYVYSSVPLIGENPSSEPITVEQVWAVFCQHPLSWILIQLSLHANIQANSGAGETLRLVPERNTEGMLSNLRFEYNNGSNRKLSDALPALVSGLGMRLLLPFGAISYEALGSWLEALLQVGIFETRNDGVSLGQDFVRSIYEAQNYQVLVKIAKPWRVRLVEILGGKLIP